MKLLVINDAGVYGGGAENRIRLLLEELQKNKALEEIHILQAGPFKNLATKKFVFHSVVPGYISSYRATARIIRQAKIDIVQVHNLQGLLATPILAAKRLGVPVIWVAHDYWPLCAYRSFVNPSRADKFVSCKQVGIKKCIHCVGLKGYLRQTFFKKVVNCSNIAVVPGKIAKEFCQRHGLLFKKLKIIAPWIALDEFYSSTMPKISDNIVFVGSLLPYKGAWVAAEALKYIKNDFPSVVIRFIGPNQEKDNVYRKKIEEIGKRDGTLENMLFLGCKDWAQLKIEYGQGGIFIFPSVCEELFGLAWAEAMAAGVPVITSDSGGLPEFVINNGYLVKQRQSEELASAVIALLKDKDRAFSLAKNSREYALNAWKVDRAANQFIDIYQKL